MSELLPEKRARQQIDAQLVAAGSVVQDYRAVDFSAARGLALREVPLKAGPCDYLLLVDRTPVGVVEAKKAGAKLSTQRLYLPIAPLTDQRRSARSAYLRVANVQRGYLDRRDVKMIVATEEEIEEPSLKGGDILFKRVGDRDKLGRGWVWNDETGEYIHRIISKSPSRVHSCER